VEKVKDQMGYKAVGCKVIENRDSFVLKETQQSYQNNSDKAIQVQPEDNIFCWQSGTVANPDSNMSLKVSF